MLHAGDAYFFRGEMDVPDTRCPPALRFYRWLMSRDRGSRLETARRLRFLAQSRRDVTVFCSQDPVEYARLAANRHVVALPEPDRRDCRAPQPCAGAQWAHPPAEAPEPWDLYPWNQVVG